MSTKYMKMALLRCLILTCHLTVTAAAEYDIPLGEQKTPAFKDYEMFQDIFPLTRANFSEVVLRRPDAWVVIFHTGMLERTWKSMAVKMRGVIWVGMIDVNTNKELLQEMDYDPKIDTHARVYTYGNEKSKLKTWRRVSDADTARSGAVNSLPDKTIRTSFSEIEDFVVDSFMAKPSRFPAIFVTDDKRSSAIMKAIALRFQKYFHFGLMVKPSLKDLGQLGMHRLYNNLPGLLILSATEHSNLASPQFNAIPFDEKTMGEFNYPNILAFLFSVNREFRHLLPGENMSNEREAVEMEELLSSEALRFDVQGLRKPEGSKVVYEEIKEIDPEDPNLSKTMAGNRVTDEL